MADGERTGKWWLGLGVVATFALVLTAFAYAGRLSSALIEADKAIHFTVAGLLAFFLHRATAPRSTRWIIALLAVIGAEEIAQRLSVNRSSSIFDYAADVAGVVVFVSASRRFFGSKAGRTKPTDDVAK